jgi:hypothetical protein
MQWNIVRALHESSQKDDSDTVEEMRVQRHQAPLNTHLFNSITLHCCAVDEQIRW